MPPEPIDPALSIFAFGTILLSIVACVNVLHMRRSGPVLPYEPRRPVPWRAIGSILAAMFVLNAVSSALMGGANDDAATPSHPLTPSSVITGMVVELVFVGAFLFVIALFTKPTPRDLGLPTKISQWIRDVCVGGAACLAALAPVMMLQETLMHLFFPNQSSGHPLIKMVTEAPPAPSVLFLAGVYAVVVAPICEEITFRLLLQGWLERWEDERLGWRRTATIEAPSKQAATADGDAAVVSEASTIRETLPFVANEFSSESDPPRRGVAGLPYGWLPIIVSAAAFGIAHLGYGPEPIPLFLLALVLGYLYQRTHRIVPSIVTHALFNLFTMIILWRLVYHHG